jgi:hypothetical protein
MRQLSPIDLSILAVIGEYHLEWDGNPKEWQPMYYEGKTYHSFDPLNNHEQLLKLVANANVQIGVDRGPFHNVVSASTGQRIMFERVRDHTDVDAATRVAALKVILIEAYSKIIRRISNDSNVDNSKSTDSAGS